MSEELIKRVNKDGHEYYTNSRGHFVKGSSGNPNGRPEGSVEIASKESVRKLETEGVDPISELAYLLGKAYEEGNFELAFKISSRLMEYSYSKQPAVVEQKTEVNIPMLNVLGMENTDASVNGDDSQEQETDS